MKSAPWFTRAANEVGAMVSETHLASLLATAAAAALILDAAAPTPARGSLPASATLIVMQGANAV
jgi:hypothetical protein